MAVEGHTDDQPIATSQYPSNWQLSGARAGAVVAARTREHDWVDGLTIGLKDSKAWFNVRASNTEPLLRLNLESLVSHEDMERRRDELLGLIRG